MLSCPFVHTNKRHVTNLSVPVKEARENKTGRKTTRYNSKKKKKKKNGIKKSDSGRTW